MSRQATREVEFYTEGKLVKTVTDAETARAIGCYKDVYNKITRFDITACPMPAKRDGFTRIVIQAQSHGLRILCSKEYIPNVPEILDGAQYECVILNRKNNTVDTVPNNVIERHYGGVPMLYYKLFSGRIR